MWVKLQGLEITKHHFLQYVSECLYTRPTLLNNLLHNNDDNEINNKSCFNCDLGKVYQYYLDTLSISVILIYQVSRFKPANLIIANDLISYLKPSKISLKPFWLACFYNTNKPLHHSITINCHTHTHIYIRYYIYIYKHTHTHTHIYMHVCMYYVCIIVFVCVRVLRLTKSASSADSFATIILANMPSIFLILELKK